jgi:hypothetical protein
MGEALITFATSRASGIAVASTIALTRAWAGFSAQSPGRRELQGMMTLVKRHAELVSPSPTYAL